MMVLLYKRASILVILLLAIFPYHLTYAEDSSNDIPHDNINEFELSKISPNKNELVEIPQDSIGSDTDTEIETEFEPITSVLEPTDEWQTIQPGQSIPRGCHVRINLETGKKEAKWAEERNTHMFKLSPNDSVSPSPYVVSLHNSMEKPEFKYSTDSTENLNKTLRILDSMYSTDNETYILLCLDELEQLLSDGDLAQYVTSTDHFTFLITLLHSPNPGISTATCLVIGSMWQNNQQTQLTALEGDSLHILIDLLRNFKDTQVDPSSVLFAISTLLRGLPYGLGMQYFNEFNLAGVLAHLASDSNSHRVMIKSLRFTTFLLDEFETEIRDDAQLADKRNSMIEDIHRAGYCRALNGMNNEELPQDTKSEMRELIITTCVTD